MFRSVLKSQYHASLAMLREAVERCPADEWSNASHKNKFWQLAYHTLFFTHLYLQRDEAAFQPWAQHRGRDDGCHVPVRSQESIPRVARNAA